MNTTRGIFLKIVCPMSLISIDFKSIKGKLPVNDLRKDCLYVALTFNNELPVRDYRIQ
jgi:hypothetical protein